jgi:hypothetical protein
MHNFERRDDRLAPFSTFIRRVIKSLLMASGLIAFCLLLGIIGYRWLAGLNWVDSLLEASMILGGMGPVTTLRTDGAKIFASFYALFSGVVFIGVMGLVLAPAAHRLLHKFHLADEDENDAPAKNKKGGKR